MKFSILIIDDNKDLTDIYYELLTIMGYKVTTALSREEGIAKAKELYPQVIICDIAMPGMNGNDVAKIIRQEKGLQDVYLIALSGFSSHDDIKRSFEAGFDKHLRKPVDLATLEMVLNDLK